MATNYGDSIDIEGLTRTLRMAQQFTTQATANSTLTLTTANTGHQQFTGSTAGQIVKLGDATTYQNGLEWWLINDSTTTIAVQNNSGSALITLQPTARLRVILKDGSTAAGVWIITLASTLAVTAGGLLIANFASTANSNSNVYLSTWNISTSDTEPAIVPVGGTISRVTVSTNGSPASGTISFRVNTTAGAAAFSVTLSNQSSGSFAVSYPVNAGDQINCHVDSGASGMAKPLVSIYM